MPVIKIQTTVRLNPIVYAKFKKISENENRSVTNMIDTMIKQKITKYENIHGEIPVTDEEIGLE